PSTRCRWRLWYARQSSFLPRPCLCSRCCTLSCGISRRETRSVTCSRRTAMRMRGTWRERVGSFLDPAPQSRLRKPAPMRARIALALQVAAAALALVAMSSIAAGASEPAVAFAQQVDDAVAKRLLAMDPERISAAEVGDVLALVPAPRIINVQG